MKTQTEKPGRKPLIILAGLILLVVAAGILIPRWLEHPNEKAAKATLWKIYEAQNTYYERYGCYSRIHELRKEGLVDFKLENEILRFVMDIPYNTIGTQGTKEGYCFLLAVPGDRWKAFAWPSVPGKSGTQQFYVNQSGKWRSAPCMSEEDKTRDFRKSRFPGW